MLDLEKKKNNLEKKKQFRKYQKNHIKYMTIEFGECGIVSNKIFDFREIDM